MCTTCKHTQTVLYKDVLQRHKDELSNVTHATVEHVDALLEKKKGNEGDAFYRLMQKYGVRMAVCPSVAHQSYWQVWCTGGRVRHEC